MRVPRLYAIADRTVLAPMPLAEAVRRLADEGVGWIQLRAKGVPDARLFEEYEAAVRAAEDFDARVWINDRADLVRMLAVSGLHLGQGDLSPGLARRVVGDGVWVGRSTHGLEQVAEAEGDPAVDVIAVGPVFGTVSKSDAEPAVGLDLVRRARGATGKPLVAIGGIRPDNAESVFEAGADTVAVLGAVCSGDLVDNVRRFRSRLGPLEGESG